MEEGSIELITGPMFSKKTTKLIALIRKAKLKYGSANVLAVKHSIDDRYDAEKIVSHDANTEKAIAVPNLSIVQGIINYYSNIKIIYIDEGQFFADLRPFCEHMRDSGKHIVVAGLDKNYLREDFRPIAELRTITNIETVLCAKCVDCNKKAQYSFRNTDDTSTIVVGGAEKYVAVCGHCYDKRVAGN